MGEWMSFCPSFDGGAFLVGGAEDTKFLFVVGSGAGR